MATKTSAAKEASAVTKVVATKHPKALVQEALQTTFVLKGTLKRVQLMYLRVGELLVKVREGLGIWQGSCPEDWLKKRNKNLAPR